MSDVADFFKKMVQKGGEYVNNAYNFAADVTAKNPFTLNPSLRSSGSKGLRDVADFAQNEIVNKADLRGAELETFLRGFPIIGGIINGAEGVNQLEDLYKRTGKVPAYPGANSPGAGGISSSAYSLARKIEEGSHDLYQFYSGEPDQFRQMMNGAYL